MRGATDNPGAQPQPNVSGALCLMSDLTELTALQKQIRWKENLAALGEMSAGIAHEFKNSLATISGYAQMIRSEALAPATLADGAERIVNQTRALTHVVTEFLRFARPLEICYETVAMEGAGHARVRGICAKRFRNARSGWRGRGSSKFPATKRSCARRLLGSGAQRGREAGARTREKSQKLRCPERSRNSAGANGSAWPSRTTARAFSAGTAEGIFAVLHHEIGRHRARVGRGAKSWRCNMEEVLKHAIAQAQAARNFCCGFRCARNLSPRILPRI